MAPSSSSSSSSSSMSISQTVTQLLKQTSHYDKDERYMATSDLCALLKKPPPPLIHPSSSSNSGSHYPQQPQQQQYYHPMELKLEKEICTTVLRLLHDKSNDVQAIAVKTLGVLITTMTNTDILIEISNSLLDQIMDATKMELRDIYTAGLRTVVQTCDTPMGIRVTPTLIPRLLDVLRIGPPNVHPTTTTTTTTTPPSSSSPPLAPQMEEMMVSACDVLMDCIVRFGTSVIQSHETILQVCLDLLLRSSSSSSGSSRNSSSHSTSNPTSSITSSSSTMMVRKRTGNVLACLATVLNDTLLHQLIEALLHPIEASQQEPPPSSHTSNSSTGSNSNYNHNADMTRTLIRTMCSISGSVGQRFQQYHIDRIIPIFLPFTDPNQAITGDDDDEDHHDDHPAHSNSDHSHPNQNNTGLVMNELREACFIGYTSFIVSCPQEMEHHLPSIIVAALAYMRYDPNYSYGNDNTAMEDDGNNDDQDGDDGDDDEYEDEYDNENDDDEDDEDDDESWKVRRSAIRTIKAIVEMKFPNTSAYHSHMGAVWTNPYSMKQQQLPAQTISQALMERFMEREENCRVDIMDCFTKLLSTTIQLVASGESTTTVSGSGGILNSSSSSISSHALQFSKCSDYDDVVAMETTDTTKSSSNNCTITIIPISTEYAPVLVKSCATMLSKFKKTSGNGHNTNDRSKSAALNLLSTLCTVPGSGIGSYNEIQIILQQIQLLLGGGNAGTATTSSSTNSHTVSKAIRLDALSLLHTMLASDTHNPVDIRRSFTEPFVQQLCSVVVQEQWYKVIAEALRVMSYIPRYFVVTGVQSALPEELERTTVMAKELYVAIEPLLAAHDVDSEIKEGALRACAALLQYLPSHLTNEQTVRLLQLLYDRLTNETTRIAAMKAYAMIAEPLPSSTMDGAVGGGGGGACQLHSILDDSISTMASFLKLQNRGLKQSSLETLNVIISNHGSNVTNPNELYPTVVQALASLISDRDLHLCHLSLCVVASILRVISTAEVHIMQFIIEPVLLLSTSSLFQDPALDSLLVLLKEMMISKAIDFSELYAFLQAKLSLQTGKHGVYNLSKCIAVITANATVESKQKVLQNILSVLHESITPSDNMEIKKVHLSLLISGDLGRMLDLLTISDSASQLLEIYAGYFDSPSEEVKNAAAYALGNVAVCSSNTFLQSIVEQLESGDKKHTYLLLSALREFIIHRSRATDSSGTTSENVTLIVPALERYCSDEEEGVRTMVAECLGSLTCQQPDIMFPKLEQWLLVQSATDSAESKASALVSWTIISAIKLAIAGKVDSSLLAASMPTYVKMLHHKDVSVRHASLLMIYSAVHHMPVAISSLMKDDIMSSLYELAKLKLERKVDLGPFTHTVDDALPLRKAALSIFSTCMENVPGSVDASEFIVVLMKALGDVEDMQLHAHQILIAMCSRQPSYIVTALDSFVEPLEKTMNKKAGDKTGTELDRLNDWIKSALRVMVAMSKLDGCMNSSKFADFVERIKGNSKFATLLAGIED